MDSRKIDWLNIALIILTLAAAFWLPFSMFLFSYAVLGPLHYLTEINWLDERNYFSKSKATPWVLGGFVLLICLGSFFLEGIKNPALTGFHDAMDASVAHGFFALLSKWVYHLAFLALVAAVAFTAFNNWWFRLLVFCLGIAVTYAFRKNSTYTIFIGSMLPTLIHVCLFTGIFMLYGALKSKSGPGLISVVVFVLAIVLIFFMPINATSYYLAETGSVAQSYMQSGFQNVIYHFAVVTGFVRMGEHLPLNSELGVRMAVFLAFVYTYHYLNWFSKTSIIRWHNVSRKKLVAAFVIWIGAVVLYAYDYRTGLLALLFLSLLHVVFEFPLNYISISGVLSEVGKRIAVAARGQASA